MALILQLVTLYIVFNLTVMALKHNRRMLTKVFGITNLVIGIVSGLVVGVLAAHLYGI